MNRFIALFCAVIMHYLCFCQQDNAAQIKTLYAKGVQYKEGLGVKMNYYTAFQYFEQAAVLGDPQSIYALAYMKYKGFGCNQDYPGAARLFAKGALQGRDNSMYFYGLCWRNGYGVEKREDSAKYWLSKADSLGYSQARLELNAMKPENGNDSAKAFVRHIKNAAISVTTPIDKFTRVVSGRPDPALLPGIYRGWIVQYDWSGENVATVKPIGLVLEKDRNKLKGVWIESGDSVNISAKFSSNSIKFEGTKYKRTDHYSPANPVNFEFQEAALNAVQTSDSLYLAGDVSMFSIDRNEPSKPLYIAVARPLVRSEAGATILYVGPNPFGDQLTVNFSISRAASVEVQLLNIDGNIVYRNKAGELARGNYKLPLSTGAIAHGSYVVKLVYGNQFKTIGVVKQ